MYFIYKCIYKSHVCVIQVSRYMYKCLFHSLLSSNSLNIYCLILKITYFLGFAYIVFMFQRGKCKKEKLRKKFLLKYL